ncbi:MAG: hypothetical protein Q8S03_17625 [Brevundimonas sp.]|uniref:hypothetical protein n=1 Tax=Brevundimonas sp. TaxID=1871086 RepID=UPI002734C4D7|nr:hypothetical protein [Brevundimonas sp.]MDP3406516.1 hypothetical protein [Brevundimonas sp.]
MKTHPDIERDPGPGRDRFERGYCVVSKRTWSRIRREYSAGASVPWLSARYGPAERTIAAHAKAGGWRKKDLARQADADRDAEEAAEAAAEAEAEDGTDVAVGPAPDLGDALRRALMRGVRAIEAGDPRLALDYLRVAQALEGAGDEGAARVSPQDEAALAYVLERLGAEGEG